MPRLFAGCVGLFLAVMLSGCGESKTATPGDINHMRKAGGKFQKPASFKPPSSPDGKDAKN